MAHEHAVDAVGDDPIGMGFRRHLVLSGVVTTVVEIVFVVVPLLALFSPSVDLRISIPVLVGAQLVWWAALGSWLAPVYRSVMVKRKGERLPEPLALTAYRATWAVPVRVLLLRTGLWVLVAAGHGILWVRYYDWQPVWVAQLAALTALHAFAANLARAVWYQVILGGVQRRVFAGVAPIRRFADSYFAQILLVCLSASGATMAAGAAFVYFFLPISLEQYLEIQVLFPPATIVAAVGAYLVARHARQALDQYLGVDAADANVSVVTSATVVYRRAQSLPYHLALGHVLLWLAAAGGVAIVARGGIGFELDDTVLMLGAMILIAVGTALYQLLWHRELLHPLLDHLTVQHRLPVRSIRASLSLRAKLLIYFGGMLLFAVGLALFWAFIQYKNLTTKFTATRADLGLAWLRSEVQGSLAPRSEPPTALAAREVMRDIGARSSDPNAVYYFLPGDEAEDVAAFGGGLMGAPILPWYTRALLARPGDSSIALRAHSLTGRRGRLEIGWRGQVYDIGSVAVFYPSYRGRGPSVVRPLKELALFFLLLFGACAGIVVLTVAQFAKPIRRLERRADGMARGELAKPVSSGGEGDEVGRLTFALEEMRRALREKLRSTEEVNLDLERAVQRRTADLAKKNRELAEALEKLTRAQDQLVRAEKMASIGQLVAGIAHEINNPVNAIVNTVGPLEEAISALDSEDDQEVDEAVQDVREMIRVVQRGANRTKAIVQALHNYSRTDDENLVDVDLNRSIDDSLELLRHVLKERVHVERDYQNVGRIRGHAGQLNQVFMNLLTNAAQAAGDSQDPTVSVSTRETEDLSVAIEIRDNGKGIPEDVLPRIFDPFFTTKDVGEGTGLGLSIVHGIVERHGGTIEVDSSTTGTTFTVVLPRGDTVARR